MPTPINGADGTGGPIGGLLGLQLLEQVKKNNGEKRE
jgi:hypothetical protein